MCSCACGDGAQIYLKNSAGWTALHFAARTDSDRAEIIDILMKAGAEVNARRKAYAPADNGFSGEGRTPLMEAVCPNGPEGALALIEAGAAIDLQDAEGWTAVKLAVHYGFREILECLLQKGADVNLATPVGITPLMAGVALNRLDCVLTIIAFGASMNMRESGGHTARGVAAAKERWDVYRLLEDYGAE